MKRFDKNEGITLIALIITIIIMLILVGVVLYLTVGDNGIISRAKEASKKWQNAEQEKLAGLDELNKYLVDGNLPENTKDTDAGTQVAMPDKWKTNIPNYISTVNGKTVVEEREVANVYGVSDGQGNTVPVPKGFWYVGGNFDTGVVISDKQADQNKYINAEGAKVPAGIRVEEKDGKKQIVDELQGNQFVWIPCTEAEYHKTSWGQGNVTGRSNCYWGTETNTGELQQIKKYGGFYVARYEASLPKGTKEFEGNVVASSNVYNFEGVPESKAGRTPWNFIDWNKSQINSDKMYNTNAYVQSGLITDTRVGCNDKKDRSNRRKKSNRFKSLGKSLHRRRI